MAGKPGFYRTYGHGYKAGHSRTMHHVKPRLTLKGKANPTRLTGMFKVIRGHRYQIAAYTDTKKEAMIKAAYYRRQGYNARIVKSVGYPGGVVYEVCVRNSARPGRFKGSYAFEG